MKKLLKKIDSWAREKWGTTQKTYKVKGTTLTVTTTTGEAFSVRYKPELVYWEGEHPRSGRAIARADENKRDPLYIDRNTRIERCNIVTYRLKDDSRYTKLPGKVYQNMTLDDLIMAAMGCFWAAIWLAWTIFITWAIWGDEKAVSGILMLSILGAIGSLMGWFFSGMMLIGAVPDLYDEK